MIWAQFNFDYNDSIPVKIGTNNLDIAWSGGLNYAQFSDIDFDFDGDMDLFIFDRSKDNIRLLEQINDNGVQKYRQVKNAKSYFPDGLKNRAVLLDYDLDGKNDLFCYGIGFIAWLFILSRVKLSLAYPSISLIYVVVIAGSWYFFNEAIAPTQFVGMTLILIGLFFLFQVR